MNPSHQKPQKEKVKRTKGFTLFVALLVAALMLAIGFSIGSIILKQVLLSATGGGSQIAFYAADAAAECALFWDRKDGDGVSIGSSPFGTSTPDGADLLGESIVCGTGELDSAGVIYGWNKECDTAICDVGSKATTTFVIDYSDPKDEKYLACATVMVSKVINSDTGEEETTIDARGYNTDTIKDAVPIIPGGGDPGGTGSGGSGGSGGGFDIIDESDIEVPTINARCNLERPRVVERGLKLSY